MHSSTFEYLKPTEAQAAKMARVRTSFAAFASVLLAELPDGPDKTYIMRKLREMAMWAGVTITRLPDGTPRDQAGDKPGSELATPEGKGMRP